MARPLPGLIDLASAAGLRCAAFYSWEPLRDLSRPGSITFSYCLNTAESDLNSDRILGDEVTVFGALEAARVRMRNLRSHGGHTAVRRSL